MFLLEMGRGWQGVWLIDSNRQKTNGNDHLIGFMFWLETTVTFTILLDSDLLASIDFFSFLSLALSKKKKKSSWHRARQASNQRIVFLLLFVSIKHEMKRNASLGIRKNVWNKLLNYFFFWFSHRALIKSQGNSVSSTFQLHPIIKLVIIGHQNGITIEIMGLGPSWYMRDLFFFVGPTAW